MENFITDIHEMVEIKKVFVGRLSTDKDCDHEIRAASLCGRQERKFMHFGIMVKMSKGGLVIIHEKGYIPVPPENEEEVLEAERSGVIYRKPLHQIFHFLQEIDYG